MDDSTLQELLRLIPDFGVAILFFYIYNKERKTNTVMVDGLMEAYKKSAEAQLKTANAIDNNTKAVELLVKKVEQVDETTRALISIQEKINDVWRNTSGRGNKD
jgi:hypothetical protein